MFTRGVQIDNRQSAELTVSAGQATALCDRNFGIGADGIIFATPGKNGSHFSMRILNNDGSEAEMCGNGIRCLAKFISERDQGEQRKFKIDTLAGRHQLPHNFLYLNVLIRTHSTGTHGQWTGACGHG